MSRKLSYDRYLFGAAILILIVGLAMIYSASAIMALQKTKGANPYFFLVRQCVFLAGGSVLMLALMHLDLKRLRDPRVVYGLLGAVAASLVFVLFEPAINGTHRWFVFPGFQFQPSEIAKPAIILFFASYLAQKEERINELSGTLLPLVAVLATIAGLILMQPDFGTAAVIIGVAAMMIFVAGLSWQRIAIFSIAFIPLGIVILISAAYRRDRLLTFLNPELDPLGKGFQAMQSLIALGTGGFSGLGIGNGRQKLFFLPEPHTDFIFAIIGEELGFIGAFLLLSAFAFLVWRGLRVVQQAKDRFTYYTALGFTLLIALQVLVNTSVALCLMPTKGIPMPLVSYGGSSLMMSMIAVGTLLNLSQETQ